MISLKYKAQRIGRYGNQETTTLTIPWDTEEQANQWLDIETRNGWTILEMEIK
jgi:hypothetical protein